LTRVIASGRARLFQRIDEQRGDVAAGLLADFLKTGRLVTLTSVSNRRSRPGHQEQAAPRQFRAERDGNLQVARR